MSSPSIGGSARCRRRDSGQCSRPVPAPACAVSNDRVRSPGKAQGRLLRPGATGEGKTGRVNTSEPPRMPRYGNSPRRVVLDGDDKERAAENRQAATEDVPTVVWNTAAPGVQVAPDPVVSHACGTWKPCQGPSARVGAAWQANRKGGGIPGRNRTPKKRMPAAERKQESGAICHRYLQPGAVRITGRIPGLVPGRESGLTCGG